jgi:hypothetical protein
MPSVDHPFHLVRDLNELTVLFGEMAAGRSRPMVSERRGKAGDKPDPDEWGREESRAVCFPAHDRCN